MYTDSSLMLVLTMFDPSSTIALTKGSGAMQEPAQITNLSTSYLGNEVMPV